MREFKINENEAGQRFDKYLKKLLGNAPEIGRASCRERV